MTLCTRCYCAKAGYDWSDQLDIIEFHYNSFQSDATHHSPFETYYGFQPAALGSGKVYIHT